MIRIIDEELREACATGDESKAQTLIGQGANVNSANKVNGWTALHWAAYRGHRGLVMYLLNKGADPTIMNKKGETVTSVLSKYTLDLLDGKEVEEASQYPLPTQEETLRSLPILPNYIKNQEFPYSSDKSSMVPPAPAPRHHPAPEQREPAQGAVVYNQQGFQPVTSQHSGVVVVHGGPPRVSHMISAPNHVISAPNHVISAPNHVISAPNHVISAPNHVISAPNHVISATSQVVCHVTPGHHPLEHPPPGKLYLITRYVF